VNPFFYHSNDNWYVYPRDRGFYAIGKSLPKSNLIKGIVYEDKNRNCEKNERERGLPNRIIIAQPGNYYAFTDSTGHYTLAVDTGSYTIRQIFSREDENIIEQICPNNSPTYTVRFTEPDQVSTGKDFGNHIIQPTSKYSQIKGVIFEDRNGNCRKDTAEKGMLNVSIFAQPGNYFASSDSLGYYTISIPDTGTYTIWQVVPGNQVQLFEQVCPINPLTYLVKITQLGDSVLGIDFANQIRVSKPHLSISLSSDRRRRCFTSNTTVSYSNTGTTDAQDVKVYVKLPPYVKLVKADASYAVDRDKNYVFSIAKLAAGGKGSIQLLDSVICNDPSIRGLTQCTRAWITPFNEKTPSSYWDRSDIQLKAACGGEGKVRIALYNTGAGTMADSSAFRIYLDAQLALLGNYKINKGDSLILTVPAKGQMVHLEADQRPEHPRKKMSSISVEACGTKSDGTVSKGYVTHFPPDDAEAEVDEECLPIIDSYDPNDKLVSPRGTTTEKFTPTQAELDYVIRFQNTGTDVAYKVEVVDTLSEHLDLATLNVRGASHNYIYSVSGKGRPVLTWTFNNILLPDSTTNLAGSNGYVHFSIRPKENLSAKTRIENFADIFFDYNDPVRTNTTLNTLYDVPPVVVESVRLDRSTVMPITVTGREPDPGNGFVIYPNPHSGHFTVEVPVSAGKVLEMVVLDALGRKVVSQQVEASNPEKWGIDVSDSQAGTYFLKIQTAKGAFVKRIVKH